MILDDVHRGIQKNKKRKRIGRGTGSGHGKTSGRGHKGYGSRAGSSRRLGFEGGQMPLFRRVAKVGFNNAQFATKVAIVNVSTLDNSFNDGDTVTVDALKQKGLISGRFDVVKILGKGEISKKLTVQAHRFSTSASEKIQASGGGIETLGH
ncbi:MAG: 50S ribosomal protein L15 [Planctomycetaceae bacterium]|nr:50S ribosomal protein L15 [Planctomycetaceae bacterium]